jgi:hypothetical protein
LQFAILTAARSGEVRGAIWSEIDKDRAARRFARQASGAHGRLGGLPRKARSAGRAPAVRQAAHSTQGGGMSGHPGAEARDISLQAELALRTALNVLRDSIETGRMPSGLALAPEALAMHAVAIVECERLLAQQPAAHEAVA